MLNNIFKKCENWFSTHLYIFNFNDYNEKKMSAGNVL